MLKDEKGLKDMWIDPYWRWRVGELTRVSGHARSERGHLPCKPSEDQLSFDF